jgi:manganese transport protein
MTDSPRRVRRSGAAVRALLLDAARELFAAKGYAGTTTREIIQRAGVSEQSLFSHFESKQGLFEAAVLEPFEEFIDQYTNKWADALTDVDDPAEMLARYVDGLYMIVREQRRLFLALSLDHFITGPGKRVFDQIEQFTARLVDARGYVFDPTIAVRSVVMLVVSMALLAVQHRRGQRRFERVVTGLLLVVAVGFLAGLFVAPPSGTGTLRGLVPGFDGVGSLLIATSMLGATVMPHAIYLHSALARDRHGHKSGPALRKLLSHTRVDVGTAMIVAGGVNLAMVLLAARALRGRLDVGSLAGVYHGLSVSLGGVVAVLFAVGLLAAGLASTSVGCYAGSVVAGGLLRVRFPIAARRVVTLVPALALLAAGADPTRTLLLSQVVLSFGVPFALIPLVRLTGSAEVMGDSVNSRWTTALAWVVAGLIVALNVALVVFSL